MLNAVIAPSLVMTFVGFISEKTPEAYIAHPNRSKQAFEQLVEDWEGILVSNNYGVYVNWVKSTEKRPRTDHRKAL